MEFCQISPRALQENPFSLIGERWMLITAGNREKHNCMTASWGGVGVLWGKDVAFIFVRPTRFTYGLLEENECFSLTFYEEKFRPQLQLCGKRSGRDTDKTAACGFTLAFEGDTPYFTEASLVLCCKKLYYTDLQPEQFLDPAIQKFYDNDYHRMYVAEITAALKK